MSHLVPGDVPDRTVNDFERARAARARLVNPSLDIGERFPETSQGRAKYSRNPGERRHEMRDGVLYAECATCGGMKVGDSFHAFKRSPIGLAPVCKPCRKEYRKRGAR